MSLLPWSVSVPRYWPEAAAAAEERPIRRWSVLHACDEVGITATVAEAQIASGMRPSILTARGWYRPLAHQSDPVSAVSLIHEWQQVRLWRQRLVNELVEDWAEVLHAHCFAAAMAGLRGSAAVVYDLACSLGAGISPKPCAWLLRSLRRAEQFALSRAGAVVVHSQAMWTQAIQRGVEAQNLFLVPDPVEPADFIESHDDRRDATITLFAPGNHHHELLIEAFAALVGEIDNARLLLEADSERAELLLAQAAEAGIVRSVEVISAAQREGALSQADIVIASAPGDDSPGATLISALLHGRPVLAADVPQHREVTPQGRGCVWYRNDDARDLAGRAAFLARNRDFRAALAISGRAHLQATRGRMVIARKYDDVYRHAFQRWHRDTLDPLRKLEIAQACF
ncbi:MAG TPA: glycosyltransferase family 4 protein [Terriglobales bacterium]|nr:glycosyltransferase family 4 protein [Terriglobales bacterium]